MHVPYSINVVLPLPSNTFEGEYPVKITQIY